MCARRIGIVVAAAVAGLVFCGCALTREGKASAATSKVKAASLKLDDGKQTVLVATAAADNALFFTRPPYDLNGSWRTDVTCGIYDPRALPASVGTLFGLEADLRGTTPIPSQFYGVYARYFASPQGLQVFAASHGGNHGQTFFSGATRVDLALESNGVTVTYLARDAAVGGAYSTLATVALASPSAPHQAGFGMFGAGRKASIGFTSFRIPANGTPADPQPAAQQAMDACYEAALLVLEAAYAVDGPVVLDTDVAAAADSLTQAAAALAEARLQIEGLSKGPDVAAALAAVDAATLGIAKAQKALDTKGVKGAGTLVKAVPKKLFGAAFQVTDALITDDLRAALPGGGL